jgi:hypothetical protein
MMGTELADEVMEECQFVDEALRTAYRLGALAATRVIRRRVFDLDDPVPVEPR